jgi:ribulose-5-phosphate 4-epimerase/fuculose-1-phosphate aldolase
LSAGGRQHESARRRKRKTTSLSGWSSFGCSHLIYNHITAKVPGEQHRYLINPYGLAYDEAAASNLVKIDLGGRIVEPTPHEINPDVRWRA